MPFDEYVSSLGRLTAMPDPTVVTPAAEDIREAVASLQALEQVSVESLAAWVLASPAQSYVLALAVGVSREKLKNLLRHWFNTAS